MKLLQVLFLVVNTFSAKLFTKVIQTPIFESDSLCAQHHIVLLKETPFIESQSDYSNIYAVDFSPTDDITDTNNAWKIFLGKPVKGQIKMVYFDNIDHMTLVSDPSKRANLCPLDSIEKIDRNMYCKIKKWDLMFQLYNHNCQHFGRYLCNGS